MPKGDSVKRLQLLLIGVLLLPAAGCFPKCLPSPKPEADVRQTQKLPVRISGISYVTEAKVENPEDADKVWWNTGRIYDVAKITAESLQESPIADNATEPVASLRVRLHAMTTGSRGGLLYSSTPARYAATYEVYNPEDGAIYLRREYVVEKAYESQSDSSCTGNGEGVGAFYSCVNDATGRLIDELYAIQGQAAAPSPGRLHGSLGKATTTFPLTRDNINWLIHSRDTYGNTAFTRLYVELPAIVTNRVQQAAVFDHSAKDIYNVRVVIPEFQARGKGWFSDASYAFKADAVIYRNGTEVANVELDSAAYEGKSLDEIMAAYATLILEKLRTLQ